ncbi:tRNA dimethylallyltransferase [Dermatophagoides farinae]|uniref:tRNA dimethylallyltransferase n=2 Tax=Dermatophagoides farinae TaxID=6954 RepID=A0A922L469_DERFA|nr:tRNA dimethylallyltransferase-like [Dermatophagoides farinae]KAH9516385.1 tRNA dimethylallyltransferase [Dermatophagoides farinae]
MRFFWNLRNFCSMVSKATISYDPMIVIIGATGCGKTKLSLELAEHYKNAEIISADSMQIYKGLDIATNKALPNERAQVPHHLIDLIDPFQQFTVLDFQKLAMKSIDEIISKRKIPIIVGGTNYYIESILWDTLVGSKQEIISDNEFKIDTIESHSEILDDQIDTVNDLLQKQKLTYKNLRSISDEKLHRFLIEIDPESANILHVNNRRKVIRCLQVYQQTGRQMSQILKEQRSQGGSRHGGPLRFKNSIIFWVDCDKQVLDERLDARVDDMIHQGLLNELSEFHHCYNSKRIEREKADYSEGIFQTIGLKEFHRYLVMNKEERLSYDGQLKLGHGILMLKQRTRSYVNKQIKWIRRRFLISENIREVPNVYRLDTTNLNEWNEKVRDHAIRIVDHCLRAQSKPLEREKIHSLLDELAIRRMASNDDSNADQSETFISGQFYCDLCQVQISGGKSYKEHLQSKKHRYQIKQSRLTN